VTSSCSAEIRNVVIFGMSNPLEDVLDRIKSWPQERQDDVARLLDEVERAGTGVVQLSEEERQAVQVGLDQAKRGEFVADVDMAAFWERNKRG
jgi:hypothetical protein